VAGRTDQAASVDLDASGDIQCHDQRYRIWQHGGFKLSRHVRHGQAYGSGAALHVGRRGAVPTCSHGKAEATRSEFAPAQSNRSAGRIELRRLRARVAILQVIGNGLESILGTIAPEPIDLNIVAEVGAYPP